MVEGAKVEVVGGQLVGAAKGEGDHGVVDDLVAAGHDRHQEAVAGAVVVPGGGEVGTAHAVGTVFAGEVGGGLEEGLVVAAVAVANGAGGEAALGAVVDEGILGFVAAPVDVGQVPGDGVATGGSAAQVVVAGDEVVG